MSEPQIVFREATTADELYELFCLRKKGLLNSRLASVAGNDNLEIDLESYDRFAHHMGLYLIANGETRAIGYQRGVIEGLGPAHLEVELLTQNFPKLEPVVMRAKQFEFPCFGYLQDCQELVSLHKRYRDNGIKTAESTRLVLDESVRSFRLALFVLRCIFARYMFNNYIGLALTIVAKSSKRVHMKSGLEQPGNLIDSHIDGLPGLYAPLYMDPKRVDNELANVYRQLALEYNSVGYISADSALVAKVLNRRTIIKRVA